MEIANWKLAQYCRQSRRTTPPPPPSLAIIVLRSTSLAVITTANFCHLKDVTFSAMYSLVFQERFRIWGTLVYGCYVEIVSYTFSLPERCFFFNRS